MIKEGLFKSYISVRPILTTIICVFKDLELFISTIQSRFNNDESDSDMTTYYREQYKDMNNIVLYRRGLYVIYSKAEITIASLNPIILETIRLWRLYHNDRREINNLEVNDTELELARIVRKTYSKIANEISDKARINEGVPTEIPW